MMTAKRDALNRVTRAYTGRIEVVDTIDGVRRAVRELSQYDELAMDSEGINLGRDGRMTVLQLQQKAAQSTSLMF